MAKNCKQSENPSFSLHYSVIIVGAGPAGLATAYELLNHGVHGSKILIVDMGLDISERKKSRDAGLNQFNTYGLGGAGLFSDGKLCFPNEKSCLFSETTSMLGKLDAFPNPYVGEEEAKVLYKYAYDLFGSLGVSVVQQSVTEDKIDQMRILFEKVGLFFEYYNVIQFEPSQLPCAISNLKKRLEDSGITFRLSTKVIEINSKNDYQNKVRCIRHDKEIVLSCNFIILAVGKIGAKWLMEQSKCLGLMKTHRPIDIGVRIEIPNEVLAPFTKVHRDLKLVRKVNTTSLIKTFCTCVGGIVLPCWYDNILLLGGYTGARKSANTNFALQIKMNMGDTDPIEYGFSIARAVNLIGQGKPLVQQLGTMKRKVPSTVSDIENNIVKTTLPFYTAGDINLAYPRFIVDNILETLAIFDKVMPGVNADTNVVSAPCLEFCYPRYIVNKNMETNKKSVFIVGDVAGYAKGIVQSAASGILAAKGVAKHIK